MKRTCWLWVCRLTVYCSACWLRENCRYSCSRKKRRRFAAWVSCWMQAMSTLALRQERLIVRSLANLWRRSYPAAKSRGSHLSWNIRYRTLLWFFSQMIKLYRACSLLYRRQILQRNMRLKALAEIYIMHSFAQLCNLNLLSKFCQQFANFWNCLLN